MTMAAKMAEQMEYPMAVLWDGKKVERMVERKVGLKVGQSVFLKVGRRDEM